MSKLKLAIVLLLGITTFADAYSGNYMQMYDNSTGPRYYTFSGTVSSVTGTSSVKAYSAGQAVSFTICVDFHSDGTKTYLDGTEYTYTDKVNSMGKYYDYFYADYIGGSLAGIPDGGFQYIEKDQHIGEYNYGMHSHNGALWGELSVGSENNKLYLRNTYNDISIFQWTVGTEIYGNNTRKYADGTSEYVRFDPNNITLHLTSISETMPDGMSTPPPYFPASNVPEPISIILLSLAFVAGFLRKKLLHA